MAKKYKQKDDAIALAYACFLVGLLCFVIGFFVGQSRQIVLSNSTLPVISSDELNIFDEDTICQRFGFSHAFVKHLDFQDYLTCFQYPAKNGITVVAIKIVSD